MSIEMKSLLDTVIAKRATDLHLEAGRAPAIRVKGILEPIGSTVLTPEDIVRLTDAVVGTDVKAKLATQGCVELGFAFGGPIHRFLVTAFQQGEVCGLIMRYLLPNPTCPEACPVCGAAPRKD